ncbi:MAG: hypothetical protein GVY18_15280 [Bacteroidetes bacterium]|jgi:hypothetical protein|nr:hypothetical protein [Bacteroidota bacterium]
MSSPTFARAIAQAAARWRDPEHPPRAEAVAATLEADNRWTEEALAFAINQKMAALTEEALDAWIGEQTAARPRTVGVLAPGLVPLDALDDLLAARLLGHRVVCAPAAGSPALLPAFLDAVQRRLDDDPVQFETSGTVLTLADGIIATATFDEDDEPLRWVQTQCDLNGIAPSSRLLRGPCYTVAVLDGQESEEDREGLAEDALLFEGLGPRSVRLVWAPRGLDPDPYFDAFAQFRGVFPAHADTPGALQMQKAFLAAADAPHAYGEGLEFLISRGPPEVQSSGHIRWVAYDALPEVIEWMAGAADHLQNVVARAGVLDTVSGRVEGVLPGQMHRPALGQPVCGHAVVPFLRSL